MNKKFLKRLCIGSNCNNRGGGCETPFESFENMYVTWDNDKGK